MPQAEEYLWTSHEMQRSQTHSDDKMDALVSRKRHERSLAATYQPDRRHQARGVSYCTGIRADVPTRDVIVNQAS